MILSMIFVLLIPGAKLSGPLSLMDQEEIRKQKEMGIEEEGAFDIVIFLCNEHLTEWISRRRRVRGLTTKLTKEERELCFYS